MDDPLLRPARSPFVYSADSPPVQHRRVAGPKRAAIIHSRTAAVRATAGYFFSAALGLLALVGAAFAVVALGAALIFFISLPQQTFA